MLKNILKYMREIRNQVSKNDIAENLFIIGTSELHWNISTLNKDGPDNHIKKFLIDLNYKT